MTAPATSDSAVSTAKPRVLFWATLMLLLATMGVLFHRSFITGYCLFSNDGPLGATVAAYAKYPEGFTGAWQDLNWLGKDGGSFVPNLTQGLMWLLNPFNAAKFYVPIALVFAGLCVFLLLRQLNLSPLACGMGALAAALNSDFFSTACWGVGPQTICFGMNYLALAAVAGQDRGNRWLRFALAGFAVGLGVTEGADIGALFSLFVAAFVLYHAWMIEHADVGNARSGAMRIGRGVARLALVAGCAAFMASQSLNVLTGTAIKGIAGAEQTKEARAERWDWATQWSLPKREALSLIVPGLFGYRMDTPDGGNYWGAIGRDPAWDRYFAGGRQGPPPNPGQQFIRYSGGGIYAGVLVALVAVWAGLQSFRKQASVFSPPNRKLIWFWLGVMLVSLLLAFGRHAPFYQWLYALPYFSTIRNPAKFIHVFNWALVIVFAYGIHGLSRRYLGTANAIGGAATPPDEAAGRARHAVRAGAGQKNGGAQRIDAPSLDRRARRDAPCLGLAEHLRRWWANARGFDRKWVLGCALAIGASLLGWLIYASSRKGLEEYLQTVMFNADTARAIASFSFRAVGWYVLFLILAAGLVTLVLSGWFAGRRAKWGGILLGLVLVADLGRADRPWIVYWNYQEKYATNPVIDRLREQPYEHRVAIVPELLNYIFPLPPDVSNADAMLRQLYEIEWKQHHFLYYNIQCLDIIQMPRAPADFVAFEGAFRPRFAQDPSGKVLVLPDTLPRIARRWQLTNTRYLLGAAGMVDLLNQHLDPAQHRFRVAERFRIVPKPGVAQPTKLEELTAQPEPNGNDALIEFTGALPRARLYVRWEISTNDTATLERLADLAFDPAQTVLVAGDTPVPAPAGGTNVPAGTVEFVRYAPKDLVLRAKAGTPALLLLNDKFDPNWRVYVDEKPATLLRANYIMRAVHLPPGEHTVEFKFEPPVTMLYVSLSAIGVAVILLGLLIFAPRREPPPP
jgi:hypothetical protein